MAKITDFMTPTGVKGNLFDLKSLWGMVLGTIVLLATFAMGQNLASRVSSRVPMIDTQPEQVFRSNAPVQVVKQKQVF